MFGCKGLIVMILLKTSHEIILPLTYTEVKNSYMASKIDKFKEWMLSDKEGNTDTLLCPLNAPCLQKVAGWGAG